MDSSDAGLGSSDGLAKRDVVPVERVVCLLYFIFDLRCLFFSSSVDIQFFPFFLFVCFAESSLRFKKASLLCHPDSWFGCWSSDHYIKKWL